MTRPGFLVSVFLQTVSHRSCRGAYLYGLSGDKTGVIYRPCSSGIFHVILV